jgi:hypothetical protein
MSSNRMQFSAFGLLTMAWLAMLMACSPTLNWRTAALQGTELQALLPCKPDRGQRPIELAGRPLELQMAGCETAGYLLAFSMVDLHENRLLETAAQQWKSATLLNINASKFQEQPFLIQGASAAVPAFSLTATGQTKAGQPIQLQAVWFSRGSRLFHAVIYAKSIDVEVRDSFFSGLEIK